MFSKVIAQANVDHFAKWLDKADKIVILTHVSPDGDAIGSSLGLANFFETQGKEARVIVPNAFPDFLRWMSGAQDILRYDRYPDFANQLIAEADVICCVDLNNLKRLDNAGPAVAASPARKILIDHHPLPEDFCGITISHPSISSASELVFRLICRLGYFEEMTKECAECIYTGMMTDTGSFTYNSNDREIYYIISELLTKGIDKDQIYRNVFHTYSEARLRLMGHILTTMQVFPECRSALITLSRKEMARFNFMRGDAEGFVNMPLQMKNVCFSAFLREDTERAMIKISLRSTGDFPCNRVAAEYFNGGGHLNASGGEFYGTMEEAVERFKAAIMKYRPWLLKK